MRSVPTSLAGAPVGTAVGSALASWGLLRLARRLPPTYARPWERTNHAGHAVTLLEGPAWVGGAVVGAFVGALAGATSGTRPGATARATTALALAAGALGALDDLTGGAADKGLKGHLGALSRGEVTTGVVKIVGLVASGLVATTVLDADRAGRRGPLATLVGGAVVAGAANAVNLFDLRPGRALKVTLLASLPLLGSAAAATAAGASLGVVGEDLAATSMLGDTGANAAGALIGLAVVERTGLAGRLGALVGLAALTLASERVSFTRVIEGHALLRRVDEWGRGTR